MLTFGRTSACEVLAQLLRQSVRAPVFVWVDEAPELDVSRLPDGVCAVHGTFHGTARGVGAARHAAVTAAIAWAGLSDDGALILVDDDDFYARQHVARTLEALEGADFVTAHRFGLQREDGGPVEVHETDSGPCCHASWGVRVSAYKRAGGYQDTQVEDGALARALGPCTGHRNLTHVRRKRPDGLMGCGYDRALIRAMATRTTSLAPEWTLECERLDRIVRALA